MTLSVGSCPKGHPMIPSNTQTVSTTGQRRCRACQNAYQRIRNAGKASKKTAPKEYAKGFMGHKGDNTGGPYKASTPREDPIPLESLPRSCPRCGGSIFWDRKDHTCFSCGNRFYLEGVMYGT